MSQKSSVMQLPQFIPKALTSDSIRTRAGLDDVRIHDLRHSFASGGLLVGEGLPMIGKLLGHTQVQTTARYAHLANDPVKSAANRIASRIAKVSG